MVTYVHISAVYVPGFGFNDKAVFLESDNLFFFFFFLNWLTNLSLLIHFDLSLLKQTYKTYKNV